MGRIPDPGRRTISIVSGKSFLFNQNLKFIQNKVPNLPFESKICKSSPKKQLGKDRLRRLPGEGLL
jgi:hypothetical protein